MADNMLSFVFTEDSFRIDKPNEDKGNHEKLKQSFMNDKYGALFELGFKALSKNESPSLIFLHNLSKVFINELTSQPDLEVAREWTKVELTDSSYEKLTRIIPFGVGVEYINRTWLALAFMRLSAVFSTELKSYLGSVRMFLTEKSQNLRIPERIFFHLVENIKDREYP
ncbi:MAG: ATP-dependent helicase, partial [Pseudobutyrivibrio sp.]|nr:ATP-dependent helicase [Pseudobutyrivibrio sp.]